MSDGFPSPPQWLARLSEIVNGLHSCGVIASDYVEGRLPRPISKKNPFDCLIKQDALLWPAEMDGAESMERDGRDPLSKVRVQASVEAFYAHLYLNGDETQTRVDTTKDTQRTATETPGRFREIVTTSTLAIVTVTVNGDYSSYLLSEKGKESAELIAIVEAASKNLLAYLEWFKGSPQPAPQKSAQAIAL